MRQPVYLVFHPWYKRRMKHDAIGPDVPSHYEQLLRRQLARVGAESPRTGGRPPRASAAVVPWRRGPDGEVEVYWVRRASTMKFLGGWWAFPGGGLSRADAAVPIEDPPRGLTESSFSAPEPEVDESTRRQLGMDLAPGLAACALRELFEESGLLLDSDALRGARDTGLEALATARRRLLDKAVDFAGLAAAQGWRLDASPLVFAGRWLTPPLAPMRFDNRFFLLEWPAGRALQPSLMGSELDRGEWIRPARALELWHSGEALTAPPILHILRVLASGGPDAGLGRLRAPDEADLGPFRRIEFRPGVVLLPLLTPTLPPAERTNAVLLGHRQAVLVDPATPLPGETERLLRALATARDQGREIQAIWLTHHHPDHVGAVSAVRRELGVPVCAHRLAAQHLERRGIRVDRELSDGQRVVLDGDPPFPVRVVHTPGHARGHLCFFDETYRSLIAGDLASTLSTIVIDPPEGDMDAYLESLDKAIALEPEILFPAHGPPVSGAAGRLKKLKRHRLAREQQVLEAWRAGARRPSEMVAKIYADVPGEVHPIAERQILAHLNRLGRLGKIAT